MPIIVQTLKWDFISEKWCSRRLCLCDCGGSLPLPSSTMENTRKFDPIIYPYNQRLNEYESKVPQSILFVRDQVLIVQGRRVTCKFYTLWFQVVCVFVNYICLLLTYISIKSCTREELVPLVWRDAKGCWYCSCYCGEDYKFYCWIYIMYVHRWRFASNLMFFRGSCFP